MEGLSECEAVRVISIDTSGGRDPILELTPAIVRFTRLAGRFTNFVPVLGGRVDVLARGLIRRQFDTKGRAGGRGPWRGLTTNYLKRRKFPDRPLLRQDDELYDALTKRGHPDQDVTLEKDRYSLTVDEGAGKVRAKFVGHQLGVPLVKLPVRQVIPDPLPKSFITEVRQAVKAYVVRGAT
jgi:hypothetical protein